LQDCPESVKGCGDRRALKSKVIHFRKHQILILISQSAKLLNLTDAIPAPGICAIKKGFLPIDFLPPDNLCLRTIW
jgi:hypothetical protein